MINVLLLPVQESDPTSPNLRQETLVPSRDHTHWNHTLRREGSPAPRHETGDIVEQVPDDFFGQNRTIR